MLNDEKARAAEEIENLGAVVRRAAHQLHDRRSPALASANSFLIPPMSLPARSRGALSDVFDLPNEPSAGSSCHRFSLGDVSLRNLKIDLTKDLHIAAEFGSA